MFWVEIKYFFKQLFHHENDVSPHSAHFLMLIRYIFNSAHFSRPCPYEAFNQVQQLDSERDRNGAQAHNHFINFSSFGKPHAILVP